MPPKTRGHKNPTPGAKVATATSAKSVPAKKAANAKNDPPAPKTHVNTHGTELRPIQVQHPAMFSQNAVQLALQNFNHHISTKDYAGVTRHGKIHDMRRKKYEGEYFGSLQGPQKDILGEYLTTVVRTEDGLDVPRIVVECAKETMLDIKRIIGRTIFFWISERKPERTGPGIGPHLQPNSMMCMVCTLL